MTTIKDFSQLSKEQIQACQLAMQNAFPELIHRSPVVLANWEKLEAYFPTFQRFMIGDNDQLIGYMNTIPFFWDQDVSELPQEGWDWLIQKGIADFEQGLKPNFLGGLQVIVTKAFLKQGYSKKLISKGKETAKNLGFENLVIPIRPIKKSDHPNVQMQDYIAWRDDSGKIYDPWIRTHVNSGAEIVKVCSASMQVAGDLAFWESILNQQLSRTGEYRSEGLLNPVHIDMNKCSGLYREENVWIKYAL